MRKSVQYWFSYILVLPSSITFLSPDKFPSSPSFSYIKVELSKAVFMHDRKLKNVNIFSSQSIKNYVKQGLICE